MSVLSLIQEATDELDGTPRPDSVVGNTDQQVRQLLRAFTSAGRLMVKNGIWQKLTKEHTFSAASGQDQGAFESQILSSNDRFNFLIYNTMWDRTRRLPIIGPQGSSRRQFEEAFNFTSPYAEFFFRDGHLFFQPAVSSGNTIAFEYTTKNWIVDSGGTNYYDAPNDDTDEVLLDEELLVMGVVWRYRQMNSLPYEQDKALWDSLVADTLTHEPVHPELDLSTGEASITDEWFVNAPPGSWDVD